MKGRVGKLLDMLSRRSAKAFEAFMVALVYTDQEHVADVLDRRLTDDLIQRREAERKGNFIAQPTSSSSGPGQSGFVPSGSPVVVTSPSAVGHGPSSHTVPSAPEPTHSGMLTLYRIVFTH